MQIPEYVAACMQALENAGFSAYCVGGCVRDAISGIAPSDYDLCTSASPAQMKQIFSDRSLVLAGEKHGTVAVVCPEGLVEITTYRSEGGYQDCRHPGWVEFVEGIQEDLARRDFTINAMAYSPTRGYADPYGGQKDLKNHILRAVGDPYVRFREDALRILRGVRFAVRFHLTPEPKTLEAMTALAPLTDQLARERVFSELCKLLPLVTAEDLLRYAPILTQVIPELAPALHFDQRTPYHAYDLYAHIAFVTENVPPDLTLRWAALLHDVGKVPTFTVDISGKGHFYGHAEEGAKLADAILLRLKAPTALRADVVTLISRHMIPLDPDKRLLRRRLSQYGEKTVRQLLQLQIADSCSKGTGKEQPHRFAEVARLLEEIRQEGSCLSLKDLAVSGRDLIAIGFLPGPQLGNCLNWLLRCVLDETVPNTREALLQMARNQLSSIS